MTSPFNFVKFVIVNIFSVRYQPLRNNSSNVPSLHILHNVRWIKVFPESSKTFLTSATIFHSIFRAVVWTDALQFFMMLAAVLSIIFMGSSYVDGFGDVWSAAQRGKRIIIFEYVKLLLHLRFLRTYIEISIFSLNPSPFERLSFWSVSIGLTFQMIASICISPTVVQRCVSLPNYGEVKK